MSRVLTPLGKWLRAYRIENDMLLKDMAQDLGFSSAHLSGIETGRKPVPKNLAEKVIRRYSLEDDDQSAIRHVTNQSFEDFKMRSVEPDRRDVAAVLARRFNDLSKEEVEQFRSILSRRFSE